MAQFFPRGPRLAVVGSTRFWHHQSGPTWREILGRLAHVVVVIEGRPATGHEVKFVRQNGAFIIPVGRLGALGEKVFDRVTCPRPR